MPVRATKSGSTYRVVEVNTGKVATNAAGTPVDGKGHATLEEARKQAEAINISLVKEGKIGNKQDRAKLMRQQRRARFRRAR